MKNSKIGLLFKSSKFIRKLYGLLAEVVCW